MDVPPTAEIVILTGAGISADSGLATFRGAGGLWEGHRAEEVATPEAFARDPALVHRFYNARRRRLRGPAIHPNSAHKALAQLEEAWPGDVLVITQNVDDLHERAGSQALLHMHGELARCRCVACGDDFAWDDDVTIGTICPRCHKAGGLRPAIVWFGEIPMHMEAIERALQRCDLFVAIGTSGLVYPAAGFVAMVNMIGRAQTIAFNLDRAANDDGFDKHHFGRASETVPRWVAELLSRLP